MYSHVLLPVDLDQPASWDRTLPVVVGMCRGADTRLTVMTVVPGFTMTMVEQYFPPDTLERMIADAGIVVMASHSPELRDYLLGPNAARVVRHAPVSVLVVR